MNFEDKLAESIASFQSALKEGDIVAANRQYCRVISYGANQEILAKFKMLYDQVFADEIERLRKEALSNQRKSVAKREATRALTQERIGTISFGDYSYEHFKACQQPELEKLCHSLAQIICEELSVDIENWELVFDVFVQRLIRAGHDLVCFDEDGGEFTTWCTNWTRETNNSLIIEVRVSAEPEDDPFAESEGARLAVSISWNGSNGRAETIATKE